jgi:uncharacterized protein
MKGAGVFYVYALKDPRSGRPFYIGKGTGIRAWEHELRTDQSAKGKLIREIQAAGFEVLTVKLVEALSEADALRVESELISAFGTQNRGGLLTDVVTPSGAHALRARGLG